MNIEIKRKVSDDLRKIDEAKWKLSLKSIYKLITWYCIGGGVWILIGYPDKSADISWYRSTSFWNFETSIGIGFILASILFLYTYYSAKKRAVKLLQLFINKSPELNKEIIVKISESDFTYETFESKYLLKWSAFISYTVYKDDICLKTGGDHPATYIILKNELTDAEYQELNNFLAKILPGKQAKMDFNQKRLPVNRKA